MHINILSALTIIMCTLSTSNVSGYLNLYVSRIEIHRLIDLNIQFYYIRNGVINDDILDFIMKIPTIYDRINFTWGTTVDQLLKYSMDVMVKPPAVLSTAKPNISTLGIVPINKLQTFEFYIPCSGLFSAEADILIRINITISRNNVTRLRLRRKKMCLKTDIKNHHEFNNYNIHNSEPLPIQNHSSNGFCTILICLLVFILIIISLLIVFYIRNKKHVIDSMANSSSNNNNNNLLNNNNNTGSLLTNTTQTTVRTNSNRLHTTARYVNPNQNENQYQNHTRPNVSTSRSRRISSRTKDLHERIAALTIERCRVRLSSIFLEGTFARVYKGSYTNEYGIDDPVLIKTVTEHANQSQISLLLKEGMLMYCLSHDNILPILRVSIEDHSGPFLLYPNNDYINLKTFLQKCKSTSDGTFRSITTQEVVNMSLDVLEALHYLHRKHIIHMDIAARNCLIDEKLTIQVADNALSRDLFPSDYHCLGDNENHPIKWMALESLQHKIYSTTTDVWSFGVLLWELSTLAQQPYMDIDPFEMVTYLDDGYRLSQPINCPDKLFTVMVYCWTTIPEERPTPVQLQNCLQELSSQLIRYV